jgi:membrane protein implicated in regulation of membrane protease activity
VLLAFTNMTLTDPLVLWLALTGLLVVVELLTGTFYLLVFGACALAAAGVAVAQSSVALQLVVFSVTAAFGVFGKIPTKLKRALAKNAPEVTATDVGASVVVTSVGSHGDFRVLYRGAEWTAVLQGEFPTVREGQQLRVVRVDGIRLVCKAD